MSATQFEIEGNSLDECKARLYKQYGSNYEIINHKTTLKGGLLGLFQHEVVNATYIVNDRLQQLRTSPYTQRPNTTIPVVDQQIPRQTMSVTPQSSQNQSFENSRDSILRQQMGGNVTNMLQLGKVSKQIELLSEKIDTLSHAAENREEHPTIKKIDDYLEQNEFTNSYIQKMNTKIRNEFSLDQLDNIDEVQEKVVDWIGETILVAPKFPKKSKGAHVIVVVGPTGVGKTTTIAKMAAKIKVRTKEKKLPSPVIKMITIDNIRVGAVEQLARYGEIMDVNVEKAEKGTDLQDLFEQHKSKADYIFIDTSGCSPNDYESIAKMRSILDVPGLQPDIYLAFSASTKARDLENIIRNYEQFNFRSVIVTKCDETSAYGNVLSVLYEKNKQISMITDGQQVLHSLERIQPTRFLRHLIGFQVDREHLEQRFGVETDDDN